MGYTVTYTNEAFPDDREFDVRGLGLLTNGVPFTVSEDQERNFILENRQTLEDALGGNEDYKIEGSTEVKDGIKGVLGIELSEISDTPEYLKAPKDEEDVPVEPVKPVVAAPVVAGAGAAAANANANDDT